MGQNLNVLKAEIRKCPIHHIPYEGICGLRDCTEHGMICYQCEPDCCIKTKNHPLISIEDFYETFFKKVVSMVDFTKLKSIIDLSKTLQKKQLELQAAEFEDWERQILLEKLDNFNNRIKSKLNAFSSKLIEKLSTIAKDFKDANARIQDTEPPANFTLKDTDQLVDIINSNKQKEFEKMITLIKRNSDTEKLLSNQTDLETIIYSKALFDSVENVGQKEINTSFQTKLDNTFSELISTLFPEKDVSFLPNCFTKQPQKLKFKDNLSIKASKEYTIESTFAVFTAQDGETYLISPSTGSFVIEATNLKTNKQHGVLSGHTNRVYIVRHFLHRNKSTDYIISTSSDRSVRVWNFNKMQCHIHLEKCHQGAYLYSALLLFDDYGDDNNYIVTSCPNEFMKMFSFETGKFVRDIGSPSDYTYFINSWCFKREFYIINANSSNVKIYNTKEPKGLYKEFKTNLATWHMSAFVENVQGVNYLFESDGNGNVRMWNIETKTIYKSVHIKNCNIRGMCFWNNQYILAASNDKTFKIINIEKEEVVSSQIHHNNVVRSLQKVMHPLYGESLVTSGMDGKIILWTIQP